MDSAGSATNGAVAVPGESQILARLGAAAAESPPGSTEDTPHDLAPDLTCGALGGRLDDALSASPARPGGAEEDLPQLSPIPLPDPRLRRLRLRIRPRCLPAGAPASFSYADSRSTARS